MRLFDFRCEECGSITEELVENDTTQIGCVCGADAHRIITPVRCQLDGTSGDFPGEALRWAKMHEKAAKEAAKRNQ